MTMTMMMTTMLPRSMLTMTLPCVRDLFHNTLPLYLLCRSHYPPHLSPPLQHSDLSVEATKKFLSENPDASPSTIAEKVVNEQMASGLKSQDKILIFIRAAFTPDFFKQKQVQTWAPTIAKITQGKNVMERHLISACENLCADKPKNFAVIIKQLFDEEVLEEDTILEWAGEGRTDYTLESVNEDQRCNMRAEAEPVVVWLQEDDSSDEESD